MTPDLRLDHAVYMGGDSYPADARIGRELRNRLGPHASRWTSQEDLVALSPHKRFVKGLRSRLFDLKTLLPTREAAATAVLFGRSSGARIASVFATRRPVRAVVCLAYPFRHPERDDEPSRYAHLASIDVPTLIFQGLNDAYGGPSVADDYALSPKVTLRFVEADHKMRLDAQGWAFVEREATAFLAATRTTAPEAALEPAQA